MCVSCALPSIEPRETPQSVTEGAAWCRPAEMLLLRPTSSVPGASLALEIGYSSASTTAACGEASLRPHRESRLPRRTQRRGHVGELAQQPPGLARVDHLLHPERSPPSGTASAAGSAAPRSRPSCACWVRRGVDLGAIGRLDPALQRQRSPACRRPGIAHAEVAHRLVAQARPRRSSCARRRCTTARWSG